MKIAFADFLKERRAILFDGAMGTMLYASGIYINRCFEEANLSNPSLVQSIHQKYIRAGAEVIQTNTFGANRVKLGKFSLDDKLKAINADAVKIAREVVGPSEYVAGSIGPLGIKIEPYGPTSFAETEDFFTEQAEVLLGSGVDLISLETFVSLQEIECAIKAVRKLSPDTPIIAHMTIRESGETLLGNSPEEVAAFLDHQPIDAMGLNCSVGPQSILDTLEKMRPLTNKPLAARPNAGTPRNVEGRNIYLCSEDYFAKYAKRFVLAGIKIVGGCCGTEPPLLQAMRNAVLATGIDALPSDHVEDGKRTPGIEILTPLRDAVKDVTPLPLEKKSNLGRKLTSKEFITTVEISPPKGWDPAKVLQQCATLKESGVDAVNIPDGPRAMARMGALPLAILVQERVQLEPFLHYTCRDRNLIGMQSDLLGAHAAGLRNMLLLTGDPPKLGSYPDATAVYDVDAIGLTQMVSRLNRGRDLGDSRFGEPTSFVIGVAANPTAMNLDYELKRLYYKVDAGAEVAVTQPIYDVQQFYDFYRKIEEFRIPIIAGIWPLISFRNAEFLAHEVPGVVVPEPVLERMRKVGSGEEAIKEGVGIACSMISEIRELIAGVQVSAPFGKIDVALQVVKHALSR